MINFTKRDLAKLFLISVVAVSFGWWISIVEASSSFQSSPPDTPTPTLTPTDTPTPASGFSIKVNFQPYGARVPFDQGYVPDTGEIYGDRPYGGTYGWNVDTFETRARGVLWDLRYDTLNHLQKPSNPNATWEIGVPNGTYQVYLVMGDPSYTNQVNNVAVEGVVYYDPDGEDNFDEYTLTATVSDGRLTVQSAAGASNAKICFIDILESSGGATPTPTPTATSTPTPTVTPTPVSDLIGHWELDNDWTDSAGTHHGTAYGNATFSSDAQVGSHAALLDGNGDYMLSVDSAALDAIVSEVTIAGWVKRASNQSGWRVIAQRQIGTSYQEYYLLGFHDGIPTLVVTTSEGTEVISGGSVPIGEWVFMAGTYDGSMVRLYVGDTLVASASLNGIFSADTNGILIGAGMNSAGAASEYFDGKIDQVRLYKIGLDASQIASLANEGGATPTPTATSTPTPTVTPTPVSDLIGHWELDNDWTDSAGTHHGTAYGNATFSSDAQVGSHAALLDGNGDYMLSVDSAALDAIVSEVTIAGWVKRASNQSGWRVIAQRQIGTSYQEYYLLGFHDGIPTLVVTTSEGTEVISGGSAPIGEWVFTAGTYDGSVVRLYVGETLVASASLSGIFSADTNGILIGAGMNSVGAASEYFDGQIDQVRLYQVGLDDTEVAGLANH